MTSHFDLRRTLIYLGFAYGIAILAMAAVTLNGGLEDSPTVFMMGTAPITFALVVIATVYMFAPTFSHILTRLNTREGWAGVNLRPQFRRGWRYWLLALFHPVILTVLGAGLFFAFFPQHFDPQMTFAVTAAEKALSQTGQAIPREALPAIILGQALIGILLGSLFNCLFTFGEEFGWRSYLLMRLMPLGWRKAMLLMGVIWGAWHWPILAFGYNYGLDIPGAPWSGMLAFVIFTWAAGTVLAWLTLRGGSVWPAVIGHGAINATAGLGVLFSLGEPNKLLGPLPFGLIAVIPWALLALWLLLRPGSLGESPVAAQPVEAEVGAQPA